MCHRHIVKSRLSNDMQTQKISSRHECVCSIFGGSGWIRTTEVSDNRFTVCPLWPLGNAPIFIFPLFEVVGAGRRTRTPDLLITNQLLYQLSYTSASCSYRSATRRIIAEHNPFVNSYFSKKIKIFSAHRITYRCAEKRCYLLPVRIFASAESAPRMTVFSLPVRLFFSASSAKVNS